MERRKLIDFTAGTLIALMLFAGCSQTQLDLRKTIEERVIESRKVSEPDISVTISVTTIAQDQYINIGSIVAGQTNDFMFTIQNTGKKDLMLTGLPIVAITGTDQTDFSIQATPASPIVPDGSSTFTLRFAPAAAGTKTVTVTITNNTSANSTFSFNVTGTATAAPVVIPDTTAPTGSLSLNSGASYVKTTGVTLSIAASDTGGGTVTQMEVKNDNAFSGNWQTYATTLPWTLADPDGTKTVYIRFRDSSGNISATCTDTIVLDRVNPVITTPPPVNGSLNVARSTTTLTYTFSEAMNPATLTASTVVLQLPAGSYAFSTNITKPTANQVTLTINAPGLSFGRFYQLKLLAGITDLAGNPLTPDTISFTTENDIYENVGAGGAPIATGNQYPNSFFISDTDPAEVINRITEGSLLALYGATARNQPIGGFDQDRYDIYIDWNLSNYVDIHVFTTDAAGNSTGVLPAGQGIRFVLYLGASPVFTSSNNNTLNLNDQTAHILYSGQASDLYTLVVLGDDTGRYYNVTWYEDYNGI